MEQLTHMDVKPEALETALDILKTVPQLQAELENPLISKEKKEHIIQKIFPQSSRSFLLLLAMDGALDLLESILTEYAAQFLKYLKRYAAYLSSVLLYLGIANLSGIVGFKPPTKDLNVTAALAIMSILLIEFAGIHVKGMKRWLKDFTKPVALVTPINILEVLIKPLSLCMRLFGNILGGFVVMKLIEHVLPVGLPVLFGIYFDLFDGLIQAYVFVFLTGLFIKEAIELE